MPTSPLTQSLLQSGPLAISILLILLGASVLVWAVLFSKILRWAQFRRSNSAVLELFEQEKSLAQFCEKVRNAPSGPLQRLMARGSQEVEHLRQLRDTPHRTHSEILEVLERGLEAKLIEEERRLRSAQTILATTSVTAPFLGLFGTVIGIIDTFQGIAQLQSVEITVVGPGISEALVATGAGLFAAIPAVLAYNVFNSYIRDTVEAMEALSLQFLQRLHLQLLLSHEKKS